MPAPWPVNLSRPDPGAPSRQSLAITSTRFAEPAATASNAARSAAVPARSEPA
jgi:hypothetical protein